MHEARLGKTRRVSCAPGAGTTASITSSSPPAMLAGTA
jgi:hypothetical protein